MGASLTQGNGHFSSGCGFMVRLGKPKPGTKLEVVSFNNCACDFMMGLGKPQLRAKFEVVCPSRCRNIIGEPQNFEELAEPKATPTFPLGVNL